MTSLTTLKPPPSHEPTPLELRMAGETPGMFAVIASRKTYRTPPHVQLLDDKLYQLATGRIKRLMVFMPPRHGKSELCSKYFPAWYIGRFKQRVILTSYEATFAANWGRLARDVLAEWGPSVFGVSVSQRSNAGDWWELNDAAGQSGVMMTAGVGGAITGKGANLLIIDDPVKNMEEAQSPTYREKAWSWYTSTAYTRLEPNGRVLLIQTRWHDDDLSGRILKEAHEQSDTEPWHVLSLPAIAETDERYPIAGCDDFTRRDGEPLWPERFSAERLAAIRTDVGGAVWSALYQQHPTPDAGYIWRREWFKRYSALGGMPEFQRVVQAVDTAFKTGIASDYSVIATWGCTANAFYLIDLWRAQVEYPELKRAIADQYAKHHPAAIYIEDAASGQSVIQELQRETRLPVLAIRPQGSKEARAAAVTPLAEAGKVFIPSDKPWVADFIDEHVAFPRGAHDDMVDTTSIALDQVQLRTITHGPKLFY